MNAEAVALLTQNAVRLHMQSADLCATSQATALESRQLCARHRSLVAWLSGRTKEHVEARLRRIIRSKLLIGLLPYHRATIIFGVPGNGGTCDVCGQTLTVAWLVTDVPFDKTFVHLHADCFILWDEERCAARAARAN
jgi:hypothetical protein